ncbi:MAG: RNA pseudouridine synthase [bacterium]|nr:RNA pseudouridine synthase [bacterium]
MSPWYKTGRLFITAKSETPLLQLISEHLPHDCDPQQVIASGGVWKDRKRLFDPGQTIRARETVKVHTSPFQGKTYTLEPEQVIFENRDLLVVYKPCDLNVHAVPSSIFYNLMYGVNNYLARQGVEFETNPVTRLDRPVEGLVIFPKNKSSERTLFERVRQRRIKKWYIGGLEPLDNAKYLRIRDRLANDGKRTYRSVDGKYSDSLFVKTDRLETADIYSIFIFTGRRHQIRFHAAHYISPIIGDRLYGSSLLLPPDEIALLCRGYNIPYRDRTLKVRLPRHYLDRFYDRLRLKGNRENISGGVSETL